MNILDLLESKQYKDTELRLYPSAKNLSATSGIPLKLIKLAKAKGLPGFKGSSQIKWEQLKPEFEKALPKLLDEQTEDISFYKTELAKKDVRLKELQIRKLERNLLEPAEVKLLLVELATNISVSIKKELNELPPRIAGKTEPDCKLEIDKTMQNIFNVLQSAECEVDKLEKT